MQIRFCLLLHISFLYDVIMVIWSEWEYVNRKMSTYAHQICWGRRKKSGIMPTINHATKCPRISRNSTGGGVGTVLCFRNVHQSKWQCDSMEIAFCSVSLFHLNSIEKISKHSYFVPNQCVFLSCEGLTFEIFKLPVFFRTFFSLPVNEAICTKYV